MALTYCMYGSGCLLRDEIHDRSFDHSRDDLLPKCPDKKCLEYRRLYLYIEQKLLSDILTERLRELCKHVCLYFHQQVTLDDPYVKLLLVGNRIGSKIDSIKKDDIILHTTSNSLQNSNCSSTKNSPISTSPHSQNVNTHGSKIYQKMDFSSQCLQPTISSTYLSSDEIDEHEIPKLKMEKIQRVISDSIPSSNSYMKDLSKSIDFHCEINDSSYDELSSRSSSSVDSNLSYVTSRMSSLSSSNESSPWSSVNSTPSSTPRKNSRLSPKRIESTKDSIKEKKGLIRKIFSSKHEKEQNDIVHLQKDNDNLKKDNDNLKKDNDNLKKELDELRLIVKTLVHDRKN